MSILSKITSILDKKRAKVYVGYSDDVDKTIYNLINYPIYNKVLFDSDKLIADITQYLGKN